MTEMIDHHAMAVMMGQMCIERPVHDELREMCTEMVASQSEEILLLQSWLKDWYGITHEPEMTPGMMRQMERHEELSGADFEVAFMTMMIRHHWQAILRASQCLQRAHHEELQTLCENIIAAQSAEILTMRTWLCEWYGVCRRGPGAALSSD